MAWAIVLLEPGVAWHETLLRNVTETAVKVAAAFDVLEELGPNLGRPLVDTCKVHEYRI